MPNRSRLARCVMRGTAIALAITLVACATRGRAPVEERSAAPTRVPAPVAVPSAPVPIPTPRAPEPDWRPPTYTVKRGDTLHAIALEYGLDYRELAAWNGIENPNLIRIGDVLRLSNPAEGPLALRPNGNAGVQVTPLRSAPPVSEARASASAAPPAVAPAPQVSAPSARHTDTHKSQPRAIKEPYSERLAQEMAKSGGEVQIARAEPTRPATPPPAAPPPVERSQPAPTPPPVVEKSAPQPTTPPLGSAADDGDGDVDWIWPAKGKLVTGFSDTANLKGIDIAGTAGQAIVASAPGRVVYAGSGLRGYGKLVIIKHNKTYLSAYAHNREILVKEGQQVARGQKIAEMGSTDAEQVKLHFEIRRLGRPMDPLKFLPPA
ncbi:MAG TPA: peptidoglycan DD-metalloendopeptidase family protein [Casimicrobiaceae bacterium]|nr:peptidoglycan DD-metalloendopeptidase family protein [Casimicrobiaceae bacterium]